jgi:hypothetical protein
MSQRGIINMKNAKRIVCLLIIAAFFAMFAPITLVHADTYTYTFNGPYYDGGDVANANVGLAIQWINGAVYYFTLSANGVTPDTKIVTSSSAAYIVTWNASSTLKLTRVIEFTGAASETYNICIPPSVLPVGTYAFSVTDFAGMTNPYLQTSISPNGVDTWVVERRSLNTTGTVTFTMTQYGTYTLTIQCDQGSIVQTFMAENVFTVDLPVLSGAFPAANTTLPTFTAQRLNASLIGMAYSDPSTGTNWLYLNITHKSGSSTIFDYNTNNTGNSQTILWNAADENKAYSVTGIANIGGVNKTWIVAVPKLPNANPWLGIWDWLGNENKTLPVVHTGFPEGMSSAQISQLVAACVIVFFLGIGSFKSTGACCVLAWIVGGVMLYLGWFGGGTVYASIPNFALAGFLSVVIAIQEGKSTEREV